MRNTVTYIIITSLFLYAAESAVAKASPGLVLTIHSGSATDVPAAPCLSASESPLDRIRCYDEKLTRGNHGYVVVNVCGMEDGFTGLSFGIEASGASVSLVDFIPCPDFMVGPSLAGIPDAVLVLSAAGCRDSKETIGYFKYLCSDTDATYFNVIPNSDLGHCSIMNCRGKYEETLVINHPENGAQWGGEQTLSCSFAWSCLDTGFWARIFTLVR
jgi:hypothetical protein